MKHFYDNQIRRYITQLMRVMSNFPVQDAKGNLKIVPVMYGDLTRQVANIIRENSENKLPSAPRMSVYITNLELDKDRLADSTYVQKTNIRKRTYDEEAGVYLTTQGPSYTVERLLPTPYMLRANVDIWTSNTDQKLQILEQLLVLFNPSLELQTTDNFLDWTSITTLTLDNIQYTNRNIPVGVDSEIDIATLTFNIPIYISPPAKVKKMGVITNIITSMFNETLGTIEQGISSPELNAWDDFPTAKPEDTEFGRKAVSDTSDAMANVNYIQYSIFVEGNTVKLLKNGVAGGINWLEIFEAFPTNFVPGVSRIFLNTTNEGASPTGTITLDSVDQGIINVDWDTDSFPQDDEIAGRTTIDFIIDPTNFNPIDIRIAGVRILLLEDVNDPTATEFPAAWKNLNGTTLFAKANDIVEWNGSQWVIVFDSDSAEEVVYTTNLKTNTQYKFVNGEWLLSVDGEYPVGTWRIDLYG
jgi:hypothetical protein